MKRLQEYEFYLTRCFQLAQLGIAAAAPNPSVGAVLVYQHRIIGEGYTSAYGGHHAEVNCIHSVAEKDRLFLNAATLYVSLEPCNHFGKTPPCTHLIVEYKIPKVVIASVDEHAIVKGKGIAYLQAHGVKVAYGFLENWHQQVLAKYFTYQQKKRPYIILKWAETANGYMAAENDAQHWISNSLCKRLSHQLRTENQAIMVGKKTVLIDNPQLNVRYWKGPSPLRVVIDRQLDIPNTFNIYNGTVSTCIFNAMENRNQAQLQLVKINFDQAILPQIISFLYEKKILSIIVEGGIKTLQYFIDAQLWDEAITIKSSIVWAKGKTAPILNGKLQGQLPLDTDVVHYFTPLQLNNIK